MEKHAYRSRTISGADYGVGRVRLVKVVAPPLLRASNKGNKRDGTSKRDRTVNSNRPQAPKRVYENARSTITEGDALRRHAAHGGTRMRVSFSFARSRVERTE